MPPRSFSPTYQLVTPPEPAMSWEDYEEIILREWDVLLSRRDSTEKDFQKFFETHPCCLPQLYRLLLRGGHGPFPGAIISQPILPGFTLKIPDFLYITRDSATVYAVLIEIEHPSKSWATKNGNSSAEFNQALGQLSDWKAWFNDPTNVALFQSAYRIPSEWLRSRAFAQKYILIYGRRDDPSLTEGFNKKREHLQRPDEFHMTYDRIRPDREGIHCLCAKLDAEGYRALSIPPTMELGPMLEHGISQIRAKPEAVRRNNYISDARKTFLADRWAYWDNWPGTGIRHGKDVE